jgi:hypothetical protein
VRRGNTDQSVGCQSERVGGTVPTKALAIGSYQKTMNAEKVTVADIGAISSQPPSNEPSARAVRQALDDVLRSSPFRTSKQCQRLLAYIVTHTLAGENDLLRERVIGAEAFDREPSYDPGVDPVVRSRAAEVRKRLAQYYGSPEAKVCAVHIQIPVGSYRAQFEWLQVASPILESKSNDAERALIVSVERSELHESGGDRGDVGDSAISRKKASWRQKKVMTLASVSAACLLLLIFLVSGGHRLLLPRSERAFGDFWAPVIHGSRPTLIYSGTNPVYRLSRDAVNRYAEEHHIQNNGAEVSVDLNKEPELAHYLRSETNGYLSTQDVTATAAIASSLVRQNHAYELRYGQDISIRDLREGPDVMIGAFNNSWTLRMTGQLRYVFVNGLQIVNQADPKQIWTVSPDTDYAIVSRLFDSKTGEALLTVAGIGQNGTEAAADFVTDPQQVALLISKAPRGWQNRNLQVVLSTSVVEDTPGKAKIVAAQFW